MPVVGPLHSTIDRVIATAPDVRAVFRGLRPAIEAGRYGLPALTRILRATPVALRELYPSLREVIPLARLVATYRQASIVGPLATVAAAGNRKVVGPGGRITTAGSGTLYFANETVGGWVKRLPSDRSDPYPKPDRLAQLASRGYLTSFDCRHLNNPEPLPPLGTGVPPCLTQGPWTYRGKTAYYPRASHCRRHRRLALSALPGPPRQAKITGGLGRAVQRPLAGSQGRASPRGAACESPLDRRVSSDRHWESSGNAPRSKRFGGLRKESCTIRSAISIGVLRLQGANLRTLISLQIRMF